MARYNVDKLLTEHTSDVTIGGGGGNAAGNGDGTYFVDWADGYDNFEVSDGNTWIIVPYPVCAQLVNFGRKSATIGGTTGTYPVYAFVDRLVHGFLMNADVEEPFGQIDKGLAWADSYYSSNSYILASPSIEAIPTSIPVYPEPEYNYWIINASLADQLMDYHHLYVGDYDPLEPNVINALRFIKLYSTSEQMLSSVTPSMIRYS